MLGRSQFRLQCTVAATVSPIGSPSLVIASGVPPVTIPPGVVGGDGGTTPVSRAYVDDRSCLCAPDAGMWASEAVFQRPGGPLPSRATPVGDAMRCEAEAPPPSIDERSRVVLHRTPRLTQMCIICRRFLPRGHQSHRRCLPAGEDTGHL